jgi:hypothetical protein
MNTNVSDIIFVWLLYALPVISMIISIAVLVKSIIHKRKTGVSIKLKCNIISIVCTVVVAASYILNIGWLRVIGIWLGIPFIHSSIFVLSNSLAADYFVFLKKNIILSYITYFLGYALLPDFTDTGTHVFFGLIHNDMIIFVCGVVAQIAFVANIICIVNQFIRRSSIKKTMVE